MSVVARYLNACVEIELPSYPEIIFDIEEGNVRFRRATQGETKHIEDCLEHGTNVDTILRKPKTLSVNYEKIKNVITHSLGDYGDSLVIRRDDKYYYSIDPVLVDEKEYKDIPYEVGDIVDGNYYKGAKILEYSSTGWCKVGFTDGTAERVHINSMKHYKSNASVPPKSAVKGNPDMGTEDFSKEVAGWIQNCGLAHTTGGELTVGTSKSGKRYYAVGFDYPRAIEGEIQIYSPSFILVRFNFRGTRDSFTAKSPEEFHTLMTERFGSFIRDY